LEIIIVISINYKNTALADCSKAVVQRLWSCGHGAVCWSVECSTCRCRPIVASDGWCEV